MAAVNLRDINATFQMARKAVFITITLFAFVLIVLSGLIINHTTSGGWGFYYTFAALGIATAVLTLLTIPVMLFLSIKRKGAVTSMVAVELAWTWFLWILWLAVGGNAASYNWGGCSSYSGYYGYYYTYYYSSSGSWCKEAQALTAFAFLGWIILFAYNIALIFFVARLHQRGHVKVWNGFVTETDFTAGPANAGGMSQDPKFSPQYPVGPAPGSYPVNVAPGSYPANMAPGSYPAGQPGVQAGSPYPQV